MNKLSTIKVLKSFLVVFSDTFLSIIINESKYILCIDVAILCCLVVPINGYFLVFGNTFTQMIAVTKHGLCSVVIL